MVQKSLIICVSKHNDEISFVDTPELEKLKSLGETRTERVSHVFPTNRILRFFFRLIRDHCTDASWIASLTRKWPCVWQADLTIVNGPILKPFNNRQKAIEAEIQWLYQHNLGQQN